jgi:hypothetical protein
VKGKDLDSPVAEFILSQILRRFAPQDDSAKGSLRMNFLIILVIDILGFEFVQNLEFQKIATYGLCLFSDAPFGRPQLPQMADGETDCV